MKTWKRFWLRLAFRILRKEFGVMEISSSSGELRGIFISVGQLENVK